MLITLQGTDLNQAIAHAVRVCPPTDGNLTFSFSEGRLEVSTWSELNRASILVPATVEGKKLKDVAVAIDTIKDATKGRDQINLEFDKSVVNVKAKGYKVTIPLVDAIEVDELDKVKAQEWVLDPETLAWLKDAVSTVLLKPTELVTSFMPIAVRLTKSGGFVACYDKNHMAFLTTKKITGDFDLVLPSETLQTIVEVFKNQKVKLRVSNSRVEAKSKNASIVCALPSMEGFASLDDSYQMAKDVKDSKFKEFTIDHSALLKFLDNTSAVKSKERLELDLESDGKIAHFALTSGRGSMQAKFKTDGSKVQIKIDLDYFAEMVRKTDGNFKLAGDDFLASTFKNATFLVALNQ